MSEFLTNVALNAQRNYNWCWAASGEMTTESIDPSKDVQQCEAADERLNLNHYCCGTPQDCDVSGWPDAIYTGAGLTFRCSNSPLDFSRLKQQISQQNGCGKRPVAFAWKWSADPGGHMVVAVGFTPDGIELNDPSPMGQGDHSFMTYSQYISAYNHYHLRTYYDIGIATATLKCTDSEGVGQTPAPRSEEAYPTPEAAADRGLAILQTLVSGGRRYYGFDNEAEVKRAVVGAPLAVLSVRVKDLAKYASGIDPTHLMNSDPAMLYPVLLEGAVKSSIRVEATDGRWKPAEIGSAILGTAVARARKAFAVPESPDITLVEVPALNLVFVAQKVESRWMLAPVVDDPSLRLEVGNVVDAAEVFERLRPLAQRRMKTPNEPG